MILFRLGVNPRFSWSKMICSSCYVACQCFSMLFAVLAVELAVPPSWISWEGGLSACSLAWLNCGWRWWCCQIIRGVTFDFLGPAGSTWASVCIDLQIVFGVGKVAKSALLLGCCRCPFFLRRKVSGVGLCCQLIEAALQFFFLFRRRSFGVCQPHLHWEAYVGVAGSTWAGCLLNLHSNSNSISAALRAFQLSLRAMFGVVFIFSLGGKLLPSVVFFGGPFFFSSYFRALLMG